MVPEPEMDEEPMAPEPEVDDEPMAPEVDTGPLMNFDFL